MRALFNIKIGVGKKSVVIFIVDKLEMSSRQGDQQMLEPIKYGDVFNVSENLAAQPITPQDAALMQSSETKARRLTEKGGVAATMQSAGDVNQRAGFLDPSDDALGRPELTIGEALEAAGDSSADKPVEQSDAAAIQSAEKRATGLPGPVAGGIAAAAQSAADLNPRLPHDQRKTLGDILSNATRDLPADKAVTREDARGVKESEERKSVNGRAFPGGVGDALEAAARVNEPRGQSS